MSEESEVVLNQLEQLVEDVEPQDQQAHMWLYKVYSECRFGFLQALRTWPENEQASVGHDRAILHMIDYEIRCRNDQAATLFIAELRVPAPELQIRLDALIVELESEQQHIKDLKEGVKQYDLSVGSRTRRFIAVVLGLVYSPLLLLFGELWGVLKFNYAWFFASVGLFTVLILFFSVWARESMMKTMINRKILKSLWVLGGAEFLFILGSFLLDVSITDAVILSMMMFTLFCGLSAIFVEKILMLPTIVMLIGFFTAVFFYRYAFDIFAVTQCLSLIALAVCWGSLKGLGRKGSLKSGSV